jgi:hypothetical protein
MPPLQDPAILAMYTSALSNYRYEGYITWKDTALAWLAKELGGVIYLPTAWSTSSCGST